MAKIFLSYAHEDKEKVERVKAELERHNHEIWLDEKDIQVGFPIPQAIQIGINNCDYFAIFLTKHAERSPWIKRELATYLSKDMDEKADSILPLKFEECRISDFAALINSLKYADFTGDFDKGIQQLLTRIQTNKVPKSTFSIEDYDRLLFAIELAIRAGTTTMMYYNSSFKENVTLDERKNAATEADKSAQARVISQLSNSARYRNDTVIAEEEPYCFAKVDLNGYSWVIDPLDGTNNFVNRIPLFCTAIGVLKRGKPFIGVIFEPVVNELYYAIDGQQAQIWKVSSGETRFISVDTKTTDPKKSLMATHISSRPEFADQLFANNFLLDISKRFKHVRVLGCGELALAYVASGRLHGFFQLSSYLWDQAAGVAIVKNAGGLVKQFEHTDKESQKTLKDWDHQTKNIVACSSDLMLRAFKEQWLR